MPLADKLLIYEVNTVTWLRELSARAQTTITLDTLPDPVLDELAALGINTLWLMGVWQRSPGARASALNYVHEYRPALPDLTEEDVTGSPYAIYRYEIEPTLGTRTGMTTLRRRLHARGIGLVLDYVPNHYALDTPLLASHPSMFVQGTPADYARDDFTYYPMVDAWGRRFYAAHGRDPHFPAWIDTAQLNAFSPIARWFTAETLLDIADLCDGVRCDMAMLMTNEVFGRTWPAMAADVPDTEFWEEVIPVVHEHHPDFMFMAEVYWDMEYTMQQQGFDYTYDKRLHDRLIGGDVGHIRTHLTGTPDFQRRMVRFLENHDEPRSAATLGVVRKPAAATLAFTLPGAVLTFHGQFSGWQVKLPVQLGRHPDEADDESLRAFYTRLLSELNDPIYHSGVWSLLSVYPAPPPTDDDDDDDPSAPPADKPQPKPDVKAPQHQGLLAHGWRAKDNSEARITVANMSDQPTHGVVSLGGWTKLGARTTWDLAEVFSGAHAEATGRALRGGGLHVTLPPHGAAIYRLTPLAVPSPIAAETA